MFSVICTDKTGTLTKGEMTAVRLWVNNNIWRITGAGYDPTVRRLPAALAPCACTALHLS